MTQYKFLLCIVVFCISIMNTMSWTGYILHSWINAIICLTSQYYFGIKIPATFFVISLRLVNVLRGFNEFPQHSKLTRQLGGAWYRVRHRMKLSFCAWLCICNWIWKNGSFLLRRARTASITNERTGSNLAFLRHSKSVCCVLFHSTPPKARGRELDLESVRCERAASAESHYFFLDTFPQILLWSSQHRGAAWRPNITCQRQLLTRGAACG